MKIKYARLNCGDYVFVNKNGTTTTVPAAGFDEHMENVKQSYPDDTVEEVPKTELLPRNPNENCAC